MQAGEPGQYTCWRHGASGTGKKGHTWEEGAAMPRENLGGVRGPCRDRGVKRPT